MNKRRRFIQNISTLSTLSAGGYPFRSSGVNIWFSSSQKIRKIDQEVVFVNDSNSGIKRPVPDDFIFSQFPRIPEVPEIIPVHFPWKVESTATFPEPSLNGFGALNEGIYAEGNNILQVIATTPGTPDSKSGSPLYKNWYRISNDAGRNFSEFRLIVLVRDSVVEIDHCHVGKESKNVELSNYKIMDHSDRDEIMIALTRREDGQWADHPSWYRIKLS